MSAALVTALRESDGYLRDGGYAQTARLVLLAADEIERLNRLVQAREKASLIGNSADEWSELVKSAAAQPSRRARDLRQRGK